MLIHLQNTLCLLYNRNEVELSGDTLDDDLEVF